MSSHNYTSDLDRTGKESRSTGATGLSGTELFTDPHPTYPAGDEAGTDESNTEHLKNTVRSTAVETGEQVKEKASETASQTKQLVGEAAEAAKQQVSAAAEQVKREGETMIGERKAMAAERLDAAASAFRETGRNLNQQDAGPFGQYAESIADQIERFSSYLRDNNTRELVAEARDLARRQPEWFVAGSLAAGFFLGRFLKSSGSESKQRMSSTYEERNPTITRSSYQTGR